MMSGGGGEGGRRRRRGRRVVVGGRLMMVMVMVEGASTAYQQNILFLTKDVSVRVCMVMVLVNLSHVLGMLRRLVAIGDNTRTVSMVLV